MRELTIEELSASRAWTQASTVLGIRVVAPSSFESGGNRYECIAWLPDFGGSRGTVLLHIAPPSVVADDATASAARREGFYLSSINLEVYGAFDKSVFVEALTDWGFTGTEPRRPTWLEAEKP